MSHREPGDRRQKTRATGSQDREVRSQEIGYTGSQKPGVPGSQETGNRDSSSIFPYELDPQIQLVGPEAVAVELLVCGAGLMAHLAGQGLESGGAIKFHFGGNGITGAGPVQGGHGGEDVWHVQEERKRGGGLRAVRGAQQYET